MERYNYEVGKISAKNHQTATLCNNNFLQTSVFRYVCVMAGISTLKTLKVYVPKVCVSAPGVGRCGLGVELWSPMCFPCVSSLSFPVFCRTAELRKYPQTHRPISEVLCVGTHPSTNQNELGIREEQRYGISCSLTPTSYPTPTLTLTCSPGSSEESVQLTFYQKMFCNTFNIYHILLYTGN